MSTLIGPMFPVSGPVGDALIPVTPASVSLEGRTLMKPALLLPIPYRCVRFFSSVPAR